MSHGRVGRFGARDCGVRRRPDPHDNRGWRCIHGAEVPGHVFARARDEGVDRLRRREARELRVRGERRHLPARRMERRHLGVHAA